ncbi:MAG TPA: hypothetical protein DF637_02620 [Rikenellaceae bacterium]|jgi:cell division protein YceG involved in septum cleavage|nr:hypothetical protein [Rikenellaceae bacterium]
MIDIVNTLSDNIKWVFSGVGVAVVSWYFYSHKKNDKKQIQKSGKNSINIQVGDDLTINTSELKDEKEDV